MPDAKNQPVIGEQIIDSSGNVLGTAHHVFGTRQTTSGPEFDVQVLGSPTGVARAWIKYFPAKQNGLLEHFEISQVVSTDPGVAADAKEPS